MFSDIAGFTSQSEQTPPTQLMRRVSMYFDAMAEAIHAHRGVIDKFIGDAIMALWNAPAHDPEHARNGCQAVLACRAANLQLNATLEAQGQPPLTTRFGLHTGEAVVGNLGGADRIQYTALGANVNLAARLEGLNKHYRTRFWSARTRGDGRETASCFASSPMPSRREQVVRSGYTSCSARAVTPRPRF